MGLSWPHILIALLVFALLFGTGKISGLMGDVAKGIKRPRNGRRRRSLSRKSSTTMTTSRLAARKACGGVGQKLGRTSF